MQKQIGNDLAIRLEIKHKMIYKGNRMCQAKPFLKWAGGKGQLLEQFKGYFPKELNGKGIIKHYYEPFLGGGAVFFWVMQNCKIEKSYLNELNPEIYLCYVAIQKDVGSVIKHLKNLENKYHKMNDEEQSTFFYQVRNEYNTFRKTAKTKQLSSKEVSARVAMTIFLNRTCFNGLYRVNASGDFNVPFGRYKNPLICNEENLLAISELLQKSVITNEDFAVVKKQIKPNSFVYFDPPYRPLNKTSNFTSYIANVFDDEEQMRLAGLVKSLSSKNGVKIMLSNSDPKNQDPNDDFFDKLYEDFNLTRLKAKRLINCNAAKRAQISEILVTNY